MSVAELDNPVNYHKAEVKTAMLAVLRGTKANEVLSQPPRGLGISATRSSHPGTKHLVVSGFPYAGLFVLGAGLFGLDPDYVKDVFRRREENENS